MTANIVACSSRGVPVFREDSTVKEWVGTCTDIQDRKDSEIALAQERAPGAGRAVGRQHRARDQQSAGGRHQSHLPHQHPRHRRRISPLLLHGPARADSGHGNFRPDAALLSQVHHSPSTPISPNCWSRCCSCFIPSSADAIWKSRPTCARRRTYRHFPTSYASCSPI